MKKFFLYFLSFVLIASANVQAATYVIDTDHTTIEFKVKHLFSWTKGTFDEYQGQFTFDPEKPETWQTDVTIKSESINTRNKARDKHLRSADFFDVEKFPELNFKSGAMRKIDEESFELDGDLTLHGVTLPVTLTVIFHGEATDPWGNTLAGFTATTQINRKDFGLTWNETVEAGQLLVGEEVMITLEVEGIKQ